MDAETPRTYYSIISMQLAAESDGVGRWRELYLAALFEADPGKLAERIAIAENSLILRARQLFQTSTDHIAERHALDAAMCALQALRAARQSYSPPNRPGPRLEDSLVRFKKFGT